MQNVSGVHMPCNIRSYANGTAIVPDLDGPVAILDGEDSTLAILNVSGLLGSRGHLHPHDAVILPSGDVVVATWNPGRISYWRKLPSSSTA